MIEASLVAFLKADAGVSAIAGAHVYSDIITDGISAYPAVVVEITEDTPVQPLAPRPVGIGGLTNIRAQITSWGRSRDSAAALDAAVVAALDDFVGVIGTDAVQAVLPVGRSNQITIDPENQSLRLYGSQREVSIWLPTS